MEKAYPPNENPRNEGVGVCTVRPKIALGWNQPKGPRGRNKASFMVTPKVKWQGKARLHLSRALNVAVRLALNPEAIQRGGVMVSPSSLGPEK